MNRAPNMEEELRLYLASGYPLLYLLTHEEDRALKLLAAAARGDDVEAQLALAVTGCNDSLHY